MKIIALTHVDLQEIVQVLNESFADYIIPLQLKADQLAIKIAVENVQLDLSVGVVDQGKLVGFMLHAINQVEGKLTAYNAATGVVPTHRGQGLVSKMYAFLLDRLQPLQVEQLVLEVIEGNQSAIRAYEKMGYHKARKLICFEGEAQVMPRNSPVEVIELDAFNWPVFTAFWDVQPSWQNAVPAMENSKARCRILGAYKEDQLVGYLILNPTSKRVLQLAVDSKHRRQGVATHLIQTMNEITASKEVYVYNIDDTSEAAAAFFHQLKLKNDLAQFEMKRIL
ncbi:GNAT family N-acetyltransferase [Myroides sp. WP-1]|uniref:GNAT family N-acetyltransferase n=1 Tax=Myroides sp. WP-1 TaxID=2759944 RepID=UPI0015FC0FC1|nr:GNAT family N-acetyltransferase [Myroides sp. WP-1]MBB1139087.1 GNAT family N-acetyltransferase [Myroides sp. WP-1]